MSANLKREEKTSIKDFEKLLGIMTYAKPKLIKEAIQMLIVVAKVAIKLTGDQPCIASMGYTDAAELMRFHDRPIAINMDWVDRFLVRVLHVIDCEVQITFNAIYDQVYHAQTAISIINKKIIVTLYAKLDGMFLGIVRNKVSNFHLPVKLENILTREIQNDGEEVPMLKYLVASS
mmetsp:Transcript_45753/g.49399  ORF Transcript_45753/g.49399 Transcript_45753/m.49399 type:complete len:176 (+) Transcript_45753:710-1237(+)